MKYLVTASPRNAMTQEVYAATADDAIALAIANPNRWQTPTPRPGNDDGCWAYGAALLEEPQHHVVPDGRGQGMRVCTKCRRTEPTSEQPCVSTDPDPGVAELFAPDAGVADLFKSDPAAT